MLSEIGRVFVKFIEKDCSIELPKPNSIELTFWGIGVAPSVFDLIIRRIFYVPTYFRTIILHLSFLFTFDNVIITVKLSKELWTINYQVPVLPQTRAVCSCGRSRCSCWRSCWRVGCCTSTSWTRSAATCPPTTARDAPDATPPSRCVAYIKVLHWCVNGYILNSMNLPVQS